MKNIIRQGDVLLIPAPALDLREKGYRAVKRDAGRIVLAYGEITGHAHAIDDTVAKLFERSDVEDRFLRAPRGGVLVHEEHAPVTIPKGKYIVRRQRQYDPSLERASWVAD